MSKEITLPALSAGVDDALITRWLMAEGDRVSAGDVLAEIETDKATMELEAESSGVLGKIIVPGGARADINVVVGVLLEEGEDASVLMDYVLSDAETVKGAVPIMSVAPEVVPVLTFSNKIIISPLARRIARQEGVDLLGVKGSGPRGRIVRLDIVRAAEQSVMPVATAQSKPAFNLAGLSEYEAVAHTTMRRTIARRLLESKTTVPHFYLKADCDIEALLDLRMQINEGREKADRISINDFIIKAVAHALAQVPDANVIWTEEATLCLKAIDISVAVAIEGGLITPVLRDVDRKSLSALSAEMKALASKAREGGLKPEEYQGGGFSVSNLGMFGVKSFSAIINPPQSCILAVGAAERRPVGRGDQIVLAPMMSVTLSVDHRSVDGAVGAQWLAAFKAALESPITLLV